MTITTEMLISMLITETTNESQVGYNKAIITLLKGTTIPDSRDSLLVKTLNSMFPGTLLTFEQAAVVCTHIANSCKLSAVKDLKEFTGLGLKDAKDVVDMYCTKI